MKKIILNEIEISRKNEMYDSIIRKIFNCYPGKYLRKLLADNEEKYNNVISTNIGSGLGRNSNKYKVALCDFLQESAKMMHQYLGYSLNELPAICLYPYLEYLDNKEEISRDDIRSYTIFELSEKCSNKKDNNDILARLIYDLIF